MERVYESLKKLVFSSLVELIFIQVLWWEWLVSSCMLLTHIWAACNENLVLVFCCRYVMVSWCCWSSLGGLCCWSSCAARVLHVGPKCRPLRCLIGFFLFIQIYSAYYLVRTTSNKINYINKIQSLLEYTLVTKRKINIQHYYPFFFRLE